MNTKLYAWTQLARALSNAQIQVYPRDMGHVSDLGEQDLIQIAFSSSFDEISKYGENGSSMRSVIRCAKPP